MKFLSLTFKDFDPNLSSKQAENHQVDAACKVKSTYFIVGPLVIRKLFLRKILLYFIVILSEKIR